MKSLKSLIAILLIASLAHAQDKPTASDIKTLIDNKTFVFHAQSANPPRGRTVHLSPGYTLEMSADAGRRGKHPGECRIHKGVKLCAFGKVFF